MEEIYRHYGHDKFDINRFVKIKNRELFNKPFGGLWSSPTKDVDVGWARWCMQEEFYVDKLDKYFDFKLKDNARVLRIEKIKDLEKLPKVDLYDELVNLQALNIMHSVKYMHFDIDFEEIVKNYDAILVYMYRDEESKGMKSMYFELYGWDVDTLLVLNPDVIEIV